jgi:hypothetical protein
MEESARIMFGEYKPDLSLLVNDGLSVAKNTLPIHGGYDGVFALADISGFGVLAERPRGAIAGIDPAGNPYNFAGTETILYKLEDATADVTRSGGAYNCSEQCFWEFAIFGSAGRYHVIACNPNDDSQYFTIGQSSLFKRLGNPDLTNTVAPRAKHIGIIGTFVVLGNTFDSLNGQDETALHWSAVNDPFNWPDPGTEVATAVQSGRQPLAGDGGAIQRVVSGSEVGAVFQERSIWRMDYVGGDVVFSLNRVEPNRGLLIPSIAVPFGRQVFYLSEDGFYLFNYTESVAIGRDVIDATFLSDIDTSFFDRVSTVHDPDTQRIWILYPGSGNTDGTPNKYLVYDWGEQRFSHGEFDAEWLTLAVNAGLTIDSPHTTADPDTDGVDGAGLPSFDQRIANPGSLKLGAYSTTFQLQDFSGAGLAATLETGRRELVPGSRALATRARVLVDAVDPTVQVAGLRRTNDANRFTSATKIDEDGDAPLRKDGRYHVFRVNLPSGFASALGMDVYYQKSGRR